MLAHAFDGGNNWSSTYADFAHNALRLNQMYPSTTDSDYVGCKNATPTEFTVHQGNSPASLHGPNHSNATYVAYLFANTSGLIKCGKTSYLPGATTEEVVCGFKPAFVLAKCVSENGLWVMVDIERGIHPQHQDAPVLYPSKTEKEGSYYETMNMNANEDGFILKASNGAGEYVYIAIAENAETDISSSVTPEATISASSGNIISLSDVSGPWSTGMKVRGIDLDLKDYPDAILAQDISLTSSPPTAENIVNNWGDAVWEVATDAAFTQNVQTSSTALSASGTQSGPTFSYNSNTGYYVRTKYTALGQESAWSDTNYFVTQLAVDIEKPIILTPTDGTGLPDFDYTAESSAITNVTNVQGGGSVSVNSNGWKSVTYGGGKFVAVAFSGSNRYMYSSDGINWTAAPTANDAQSWNTITYGNGKFVSLSVYGSGNRLMYSDTPWYGWSSSSIPSSGWTSVTYGDGKFVAVAQDGSTRIAYSTNGSSWNYVDNPVGAAQWKSITYGNGTFVAVSGYGPGNRAIYSTNGISWYATASSNDNNSWNSVVYGNGKFVAVARSGDSNLVMYSTDGINWTGAQPSSNASWTSVIYADGKFVAVAEGGANRAMYSTDGINWSSASGVENNEWQSITYGDGKFVAVAQNGNSNRVMYSYTGINWGPDEATLTLTDTTVSKVSDGSLVEGVSIDQALTVGEVVRPSGSKSSWVVETDIDEEAKGIDYDSNGNVYVAYKRSGGTGVSKFDADGVLQWQKTFSNGSENTYNLKVDNSDNIIVSHTTTYYTYGSYGQRFGVFKINSSGDILWSKIVDNNNRRTANEVPDAGLYIDASDNIYVSGYSNLDVGGGDYLSILYDKIEFLWGSSNRQIS